ncbi:MAG: M23 family metallopeptidase [Anaerolineales bacterium]|nr:M23 family metallopeptidase [Anaerolineales bacterium]
MKWQYYLAAGLIGLCLAACSSPAPAPTATPEPTATSVPTALPTPEPTLPPTATAIPTSPICTPLAEHQISALLSLYLTQPFIAPQGANKETGHHGLDFAYYSGGPSGGHINGTPIQSVLDAVVAGAGYNAVYGYYLVTETPWARLPQGAAGLYGMAAGESLYLLYAHLQHPAPFELGEALACAQVLGYVGDSGDRFFVSDPHLHLETRVGASGLRLDPMAYYAIEATEEQKAEYLRWRTSDDFRLADPAALLGLAP